MTTAENPSPVPAFDTSANAPAPVRLFTWRAAWTEIWDNLPIWFFFLEAVGLIHFLCANVPSNEIAASGIPLSAFAWTAIFPVFWVVVYYADRVARSRRLAGRGPVKWAIPAAFAVAPALIYFWYRLFPFLRYETTMGSLVVLFEYMQLCWIGLFAVHVALKRGAAGFITFFVVGWLYGMVLENGGIIMGYFFEPTYQYYLGRLPAPFATMMGWCLAFYACIWIAEKFRDRFPALKSSVWGGAVLTTVLALSLDLQLDPLASLSGVFWRWNDALPAQFLSVPWANFIAWFSAFLPFAWIYFKIQSSPDLNPFMRNWRLLLSLPNVIAVAAVLFFGLSAVVECGFSGPTYQILGDFFTKILPY